MKINFIQRCLTGVIVAVLMLNMSLVGFASEEDLEGSITENDTLNKLEIAQTELRLEDEQSSVEHDIPVTLDAQAAVFNVTIPSALPVSISAAGEIVTATDAALTNNSSGPVTVSSIEMTIAEPWKPMDFDTTDMRVKKINTKEISFRLNNEKTTIIDEETGEIGFSFDKEAWRIIPSRGNAEEEGAHIIPFDYEFRMPAQSEKLEDAEIATLTFVIGWYDGSTASDEGGETPDENGNEPTV